MTPEVIGNEVHQRLSAIVESKSDEAFTDSLRQELKQIAMPKVVADSVERIFGIT